MNFFDQWDHIISDVAHIGSELKANVREVEHLDFLDEALIEARVVDEPGDVCRIRKWVDTAVEESHGNLNR